MLLIITFSFDEVVFIIAKISSMYRIQNTGLLGSVENSYFSNLNTKQLAATTAKRLPIARQFPCL
jgi:hypothetical protein